MRTSLQSDSSQWPELWQSAYRVLEQSINPHKLLTWIQPLELVKTESSSSGKGLTVHITAPNDFSVNWVRDRYLKIMEDAFTQVTGTQCQILFTANNSPEQTDLLFDAPLENRASAAQATSTSSNSSHGGNKKNLRFSPNLQSSLPSENPLDPRYNFESFVVGASNQFAHAAAVAVAEQPGHQYNPLFIYSPPGLGKTHLLHAIGNHILTNNPKARVAFLSAERFVNELVDSIQNNRMNQFRLKFRDSYDLIMIDDIQFISGKNRSEEEFFHTFNSLHSLKRQIVLTCDSSPKDIKGLEERLRTRFEMGLVADIHPPEIETRIAILKAKAERDDIYLPDDVATFLASHIKSNVRELEGVLIRLQAQASLSGAEISLEMAKQELRHLIPDESAKMTVEGILSAVAKHFHLKISDFKSNTRAHNIAEPRQIAMYLIRKYTGTGLKDIGHFFGGKDHTTILHAIKKIESGLETDRAIREAVESIQNLL